MMDPIKNYNIKQDTFLSALKKYCICGTFFRISSGIKAIFYVSL